MLLIQVWPVLFIDFTIISVLRAIKILINQMLNFSSILKVNK